MIVRVAHSHYYAPSVASSRLLRRTCMMHTHMHMHMHGHTYMQSRTHALAEIECVGHDRSPAPTCSPGVSLLEAALTACDAAQCTHACVHMHACNHTHTVTHAYRQVSSAQLRLLEAALTAMPRVEAYVQRRGSDRKPGNVFDVSGVPSSAHASRNA